MYFALITNLYNKKCLIAIIGICNFFVLHLCDIVRIDDVEGVDTLRWEDQQKIRNYVEGGGTGASNADANVARVMEYGIEVSQTSRATCKCCNQKIMKGQVANNLSFSIFNL